MNLYEKYCLPHLINCACRTGAIRRERQQVVPLARGRVLEIGMGAALNLPFYDRAKVEFVWGVEPSPGMRATARKNLEKAPIEVKWLPCSATAIPLEDEAADSIVLTYTLCTIPDWRGALDEMRRVLKPNGTLIFCEHGAASDPSIRLWQTRITPWWKRIAGGCHLDRPIPRYLEEGGFAIETIEAGYLHGVPRIAGFNYRGVARKG